MTIRSERCVLIAVNNVIQKSHVILLHAVMALLFVVTAGRMRAVGRIISENNE